jgi:hypothetical protein
MFTFLLNLARDKTATIASLFTTTCIGYLPKDLPSPFDWGCYNHMGTEQAPPSPAGTFYGSPYDLNYNT